MRGIIGKFLTGVNAVAQPLAMEKYRADIQRERDTLVQKFQQETQAANQAFTASENKATRDQNAEQFNTTTETQREQFNTNAEREDARFNTTTKNQQDQWAAGNALDVERTNAVVAQAKQALEIGDMGLVNAQRTQKYIDTVIDDSATPESRKSALEKLEALNLASGKTGSTGSWRQGTRPSSERNTMDKAIEEPYLYNDLTGETRDPFASAAPSSSDAKIQQIMSANPGRDRAWAEAYLEYISSQQ